MFFAIQKGETTRVVKAANYNELQLKAVNSFKMNPNLITLTYHDITEEKVTLDSEDTFEYVEQRAQEIKASNASYKPLIELGGDDSEQRQSSQSLGVNPILSQSMVSDNSAISRVIKPVPRESYQGSNKEVIFNDRETEVQQAEEQVVRGMESESVRENEIDMINQEVSQEEAKQSRASGVIKLATQVPFNNKPSGNDELSPLVLENHGSAGDAMASPKMSEIATDHLALPGQQPPLQSKNTQMLLAEMADDLSGMGAGGLVFDEGQGAIMRQPTAAGKDPAMASIQPVSQPVPQANTQAKPSEAMDEQNYTAMIAAVNRGTMKVERSATQVDKSSSQVSMEQSMRREDIDGISEYAPALRKETTEMMMASLPDAGIARVNSESNETDTEIKRLPTDVAFSETGNKAVINLGAPMVANDPGQQPQPAVAQSLQVPLKTQQTMETSFVTDLSMKEYSIYGGKHPNAPSQQLTTKERELTMKLNQFKKMLESLTPVVAKQKQDIARQQAQIADLIRQNQELKSQSKGVSNQSIPCFRCDGRQTEKGRSDPCRRCKGTGRVNTQHEKFLIEMIQSQIEKQIPVAMSQKDLRSKPQAEHHGVTCAICTSSPLRGTRYLCLVCDDINICETCELDQQHSQTHAMAVIKEPKLSPDDFIESQAQQRERRQQVRAQEIISESLVKQESVEQTNSQYKAKYVQKSLQNNQVFKANDVIENVWTYKNTGDNKIPKGIRFVMVAGDQELNVAGITVQEDVKPGQHFKIKISVKAPVMSKHYSAGFMLIDPQGNYFGDKVVLDIIVEDECSESVILAEMMDNVDMSMSMRQQENKPDFNAMRAQRMSMMIHRGPQNQPPAPQANEPPKGMPNQNPTGAWSGIQPPMQPPMQQMQQPPQPVASGQSQVPSSMQQPNMPPASMGQQLMQQMQMQPPQPQQHQQMQAPQASGWGTAATQNFPQQPPQERSAFDDNSRDSLVGQPPKPVQPPAMMPQNNPAGGIPASWGMPSAQPVPVAQAMPAQPAPAMGQPAMGQPAAAPQDFFNQGPMRYPTMSGLKVDAAGLSGAAAVEENKAAPQDNQPKPILKQPTIKPDQPQVEYGNKPPALPKAVGFSEANSYNEKLELAYPASRNATDGTNRQMRETFFLMKDFGYDDFEKNSVVITKFQKEGKLDQIMLIQQQLEARYNSQAAPAQPQPVAAAMNHPAMQPMMPPPQRQSSIVMDTKKVAYSEKVNKKLKDPVKTIMLQLMELGYLDYDKNLKVIKKQKKPDISVTLDQLNKA